MKFEQIKKPDCETMKLFQPIRSNFVYAQKSAIKQLKWLISDCIAFYKVYDNERFIGCLFVDDIDEESKTIEFGGFAARHVNTKSAIKELIAYLKHHYPDYRIVARTENLAARISLTSVGLKRKEEGNIYE